MLGVIEKKTLGALMIICNKDEFKRVEGQELAVTMGYKSMGGAITTAIKMLEMKNHIAVRRPKYNTMYIMVLI